MEISEKYWYIIYAKQFSRPINEIANLYAQVQTVFAGAERVFEIMNQGRYLTLGNEGLYNAEEYLVTLDKAYLLTE